MRFAVLVVCALAGCYHDEPKPVTPPAKPIETGHTVLADLPKECQDYLGVLDKRAHCDKLDDDTRKQYSERKDKLSDTLPGRLEAPVQRQQAIDECTSEHDKLVAHPLQQCGEVIAASGKTGGPKRDPRCAPADGLPPECMEFCSALVELDSCPKVPQVSKDAVWGSFQSLTEYYKSDPKNASEGCTGARDAVRGIIQSSCN